MQAKCGRPQRRGGSILHRYDTMVMMFTCNEKLTVTLSQLLTSLWTPAQRKRASMLYFLPMFVFIYFLWPPYSPALVNGSSRKFHTWWALSAIREVTTWIFSWSSLNYRVGQKVTTRKLSALMPERGRILYFWKNLVLAYKPLRSTRHKVLKKWHAWIACDMSYFRSLDASTTTPEHRTIR